MAAAQHRWGTQIPLVALVQPREYTIASIATMALGVLLGALGMRFFKLPLWGATALVLALLLIPGFFKWRADRARFGGTAMLLSVVVTAQGFHGVEHLLQWAQYHILYWSMRSSNGLLSPANAEWVHFVWNWIVLVCIVALIGGGMRGPWAWALLAWSLAHTLEHTYMFVRYLAVLDELSRAGVTSVTAQGLPGILGRDGWLARSPATQGTFLCRLPGIATAPRLDVHFWWNVGETLLLLLAGNAFMRDRVYRTIQPRAKNSELRTEHVL